MIRSPLRRAFPAAVVVAALLMLTAAPSSATVSHHGVITGGLVAIDTKGPDFNINLASSTAAPGDNCFVNDSTHVTADFNANGTTAVTGIHSSLNDAIPPPNPLKKVSSNFQDTNGTWYQLELQLGTGSQAGAFTGGGPTVYTINQNVSLKGIITTINQTTCAKGSLLCNVTINMVLSGSFTPDTPGTAHPPGVADLSGGGTIQRGIPCNAPASGWFAPTPPPAPSATVTGLIIDFS